MKKMEDAFATMEAAQADTAVSAAQNGALRPSRDGELCSPSAQGKLQFPLV